MRILVTGSRDWDDAKQVSDALLDATKDICEPITLVSGACPTGADKFAEDYAKLWGWTIERYPADWNTYGRSAGPIRNKVMVESNPDICLAFIKNNSKGASGTANLARSKGINTVKFDS